MLPTQKYDKIEIALGMKSGIGNLYKYGSNAILGTTERVVWDQGGAYYWHPFAEAAVKLQVVSDDADDVDQGSGAWSVQIWGLGENWEFQKETVLLNGLTAVETTKVYRRTFRAIVTAGGSRTGAEGNISIYETGQPTRIVSYIKAGVNQTHMVIYTVPAGYGFLINNADANVGKGFDAVFKLKTHNNITGNEVDLVKATRYLYQNSFTRVYKTGRFVDEKTDIFMTGVASVASVVSSASFEGILFDKSKFTAIGSQIVPVEN